MNKTRHHNSFRAGIITGNYFSIHMIDLLQSCDTRLFLVINRDLANPVFDFLFVLITNGKFWIIPGVAAGLIYVYAGRTRALIVVGLSLLTVAISDPLASQIIKPLVHRFRPCDPQHIVDGGRYLLGLKHSLSFPSSHSMNMFAQAMLFSCFYRRYAGWFFVFAGTIGFSRIYVGVHYPVDVLGGALLGTIIGYCVFRVYILLTGRLTKPASSS